MIMVPFFVLFSLTGWGGVANRYICLVIFVGASITDWLDGHLARKNNLVTNFGKFMDPLADKLLVCSSLICMVELNRLEAWIVIIIIARFLNNFSENRYVKAAFSGIRPAVTALIAMAVYNLCKVSLFVETDFRLTPAWKTIVLAIIAFFAMQNKKLKKLHPAYWLLAAAVIGVVFRF